MLGWVSPYFRFLMSSASLQCLFKLLSGTVTDIAISIHLTPNVFGVSQGKIFLGGKL